MSGLLLKSIADVVHNGYEGLKCNLAYYTDTNTAIKIIKNKEIWMRKNNLMNDYSEFLYGENVVRNILDNSLNGKLKEVLDRLGVSETDYKEKFEKMVFPLKHQSYILCMTKEGKDEKVDGRLSMWRGYGENGGVAFVFNKDILIETLACIAREPSKGLFSTGRFLFPVFYGKEVNVENDINMILNEVMGYTDQYIKQFKFDELINQVIINLCFAMMIQKHPGYKEEREIRFWFNVLNEDGIEDGLKKIKIIDKSLGDVKQRVAVIDFDEIFHDIEVPEGITWNTLLDKVIIGPMNEEKGKALKEVLYDKIKIQDEKFNINKIICSSIPYRESLK